VNYTEAMKHCQKVLFEADERRRKDRENPDRDIIMSTCTHHTDAERAPTYNECPVCIRKERDQLRAELAAARAPKPAPRCPKCGAESIMFSNSIHGWSVYCCKYDCEWDDGYHATFDAALDAWRPKEGETK
jgi:hypothetical protein